MSKRWRKRHKQKPPYIYEGEEMKNTRFYPVMLPGGDEPEVIEVPIPETPTDEVRKAMEEFLCESVMIH